MGGRKGNAFADLNDGLIDQTDRSLTVAALVRRCRQKLGLGFRQMGKRRLHVRLRAERIANSEARSDSRADQRFPIGLKLKHLLTSVKLHPLYADSLRRITYTAPNHFA